MPSDELNAQSLWNDIKNNGPKSKKDLINSLSALSDVAIEIFQSYVVGCTDGEMYSLGDPIISPGSTDPPPLPPKKPPKKNRNF